MIQWCEGMIFRLSPNGNQTQIRVCQVFQPIQVLRQVWRRYEMREKLRTELRCFPQRIPAGNGRNGQYRIGIVIVVVLDFIAVIDKDASKFSLRSNLGTRHEPIQPSSRKIT